jgi:hypothetical protein
VDFTDIPSQWAMDCVELKVKLANQSHLARLQNETEELCQYSATNVMQLLFWLLRIKSLYMFRALLAHPKEALHKRHFVYCVRVMSVGCNWTGTGVCYVSWLQQDWTGTGVCYVS